MSSFSEYQKGKLYGFPPKEKGRKKIASKSEKKLAQEAAEKELRKPDEDSQKEKWFKDRHKEMTGTCQCGCGMPSQKGTQYFRHSAAHIFPQRLFKSIQFHPINWVERRFWGGCHTNMDDMSMDLWPNMADFDDIKIKFKFLEPLLTPEERSQKFYQKLKSLVENN